MRKVLMLAVLIVLSLSAKAQNQFALIGNVTNYPMGTAATVNVFMGCSALGTTQTVAVTPNGFYTMLNSPAQPCLMLLSWTGCNGQSLFDTLYVQPTDSMVFANIDFCPGSGGGGGGSTSGILEINTVEYCGGQAGPTSVTVSDCQGQSTVHTIQGTNGATLRTSFTNACPGQPLTATWYRDGILESTTSYQNAIATQLDILVCDSITINPINLVSVVTLDTCSGTTSPVLVTIVDCQGQSATVNVGGNNGDFAYVNFTNACPGQPLIGTWSVNGATYTANFVIDSLGESLTIYSCNSSNPVHNSNTTVCGQVMSAGTIVTSGIVLLYQVDTTGMFVLADSALLTPNGYCLTADSLESYVILVIPNDSTRVPTFYGWGPNGGFISSLNPSDIYPTNFGSTNSTHNIYLVNPGNSTNLVGSNNINGTVFQGPRSNFRNAFAVLMNMNGQVLRSTKVQPNGAYAFYNIASGQYQIKIGYLNYPSTAGNICVGCFVPETLNFRLNNGRIEPELVIAGNDEDFDNKAALEVFPNPAQSNITLKGLQTQDLINVTDLFGRTVISTSALLETQTLDVAALPAGVYIISTPSTKPAKFVKM